MPGQTHRLLTVVAPLLGLLAGASLAQDALSPESGSQDWILSQRKAALQMELDLVRATPDAYYLVVDVPAREVHLKCRARLLRTCRIVGHTLPIESHGVSRLLRLSERIDPFTPEPGNEGLRLRGRSLPLDFLGRLVEGPRRASQLYFRPSLLIHPSHLPLPGSINHIVLDGSDVKALGSALDRGSPAVWIPPSGRRSGGPS